VDALVAMNPAALKTNLKFVKSGGIVIVNEDTFVEHELKKAGYTHNPLENGTASEYRLIKVPIDRLNAEAVKDAGLTSKQVDRCKNFYALGVASWLYDRPLEPALAYIEAKFGKKNPAVAKANALTLKAGYYYSETCELFDHQYQVGKAKLEPGTYRKVTGNEAVALGMVTAAHLAGKELFYGSYPITPASDILHNLATYKNYRVVTFQAEDEICAMGATIGAAFGGALAATSTSGPGGAQDRRHRPGGDYRVAGGDCGCAAGRAEHGLADEDRTVGSAAGVGGAQRRMPGAGDRGGVAGGLLRCDDRGVSDRGEVYDASGAADRWFHRQQLRAMASGRGVEAGEDPGRTSDEAERCQGIPAV
jgi:hypothetical protein